MPSPSAYGPISFITYAIAASIGLVARLTTKFMDLSHRFQLLLHAIRLFPRASLNVSPPFSLIFSVQLFVCRFLTCIKL